jgi:isocitrate dehydrogenase
MTIDQRSETAAAEQEYLDMLAAIKIRQACHSAEASHGAGATEPQGNTATNGRLQ